MLNENGQNDHFGQIDLILNLILALARPKWTKMVHFGHFGQRRPNLVHLSPPTGTGATPDKYPVLRSALSILHGRFSDGACLLHKSGMCLSF